MSFSVALDTACGSSLAIAKDGVIITEHLFPASGRQNDTELIPWLLIQLKQAGVAPEEVTHWSCGTGPGSYSGIRVGISWVKGICLVSQTIHPVIYRGVASSYACALALFDQFTDAKRVCILHDGRRRQLIISPFVKKENGEIVSEEPRVYDLEEAFPLLQKVDHFATVQADLIKPLLTEELQQRLTTLPATPAKYLLTERLPWPTSIEEQEASCEPVYVRPATFVSPQILRKI